MKRYLVIFLNLVVLGVMAQAQVNSPSMDPQSEQAITRLREGLVDSFNQGDIDRLLTFLDTNAVVTWQNGEVCEGAAAVKAYYERMMKGDHPVVSKVTADPKVLGRLFQGDWAVSWGNLNDQFVLTDGRVLPLNSRFTATIARRGDRWLVTAFHVSVNAFDNPVMALAVKKVSLFSGIIGLVAGLIGGVLAMCFLRRPKSGGAA
jgi:ketosteroid isomerase-like protein